MSAAAEKKEKMAALAITNEIRTLRFMQGEMTQQELADRVGVTRQTILAVENGKYTPSLELAFRIAQALGKPIQDVFSCQVTPTKGAKK